MTSFASSARWPTLLLAAAGSFLAGALILWVWATPDHIRAATTPHLLGLLSLMLLPGAMLGLLLFERRRGWRSVRRPAPTRIIRATTAPAADAETTPAQQPQVTAYARRKSPVVQAETPRRLSDRTGRARSGRTRRRAAAERRPAA